MKTDVIAVSSKAGKIEDVLAQADAVADYKHLSNRTALHLRLLTEEMMGLVRGITGETEGIFWIEDEHDVYQLHLQVETRMNSGKRNQLLSAATTGRNESARGLMGRIRDLMDRSADEDLRDLSSPLILPGMYEHTTMPNLDWEWSMVRYREELSEYRRDHGAEAEEAWDELEKSVVAHAADEV